jgi:hypothetical protein
MGSTLTGSTVASTYTGLLKTTDTGAINSTLKTISDGSGNDSALQLSTTSVNIAAASGNFTIATDKLTVAGASGNTAVAGTLSATGNFAINTNKFNVTASSGNTTCAGSLTLTTGSLTVGGSTSVAGNITTNGYVILNNAYGIQQNSAGGSNTFAGTSTFNGLAIFNGGITFNSNLTLANNLTVNGTTTLNSVAALNGNITLGDSSADTLTVAATPTFSAPATFAGAATFNGNVTIGSDATDTLSINAAFNPPTETIASGDFILIQDVSDSNKIKKVAPTEVQFAKKYVSAEFALPSGNYDLILNVPISSTGLGGKPDMVVAQLVCQADNNGYVAGDVINMDTTVNGYYGNPYRLLFNENNIIVIRNTATTTWEAYGNVTGSLASFQINQDLTNWKARVVAIKFI